jgi:hypothetical protein
VTVTARDSGIEEQTNKDRNKKNVLARCHFWHEFPIMQFLLLSFAALLAVASAAGTLSGKISTYPGSTFGDVSGTVVLTDNVRIKNSADRDDVCTPLFYSAVGDGQRLSSVRCQPPWL